MKGGVNMKITTAIANYIDEKGIKQNFLAKKTDLSCDAMSNMLNGKRKLEVDEYAKICEALNVSFDFFYDLSKETKSA
jgi:DNA-binding helix-turn-helix protein